MKKDLTAAFELRAFLAIAIALSAVQALAAQAPAGATTLMVSMRTLSRLPSGATLLDYPTDLETTGSQSSEGAPLDLTATSASSGGCVASRTEYLELFIQDQSYHDVAPKEFHPSDLIAVAFKMTGTPSTPYSTRGALSGPLSLKVLQYKNCENYVLGVSDIADSLGAVRKDVIGVQLQSPSSTSINPQNSCYFAYVNKIEFYSNSAVPIPGLYASLLNTYSITPTPTDMEIDANPAMLAWGVKCFPFPHGIPTFYLGASVAGFAAITANPSNGNSSNFEKLAAGLLIDIDNYASIGPGWIFHFDGSHPTFIVMASVDASVITLLNK
jgi:hypothetical protein